MPAPLQPQLPQINSAQSNLATQVDSVKQTAGDALTQLGDGVLQKASDLANSTATTPTPTNREALGTKAGYPVAREALDIQPALAPEETTADILQEIDKEIGRLRQSVSDLNLDHGWKDVDESLNTLQRMSNTFKQIPEDGEPTGQQVKTLDHGAHLLSIKSNSLSDETAEGFEEVANKTKVRQEVKAFIDEFLSAFSVE